MAGVDRRNVCNALKSLFEADTGTLFGQNKLIKSISTKFKEFESAKVDIGTPYKMYIKASLKEKTEARMQNADYTITVNYRVEGKTVEIETAVDRLDDIDDRIDYLIDNEMWSGDYLTNYLAVTGNTMINSEWVSSDVDSVLEPTEGGGVWRVHCEGVITIEINRLK